MRLRAGEGIFPDAGYSARLLPIECVIVHRQLGLRGHGDTHPNAGHLTVMLLRKQGGDRAAIE